MDPPEYDDGKKIDDIPEKLDKSQNKIQFSITVSRHDARWISSRIYEDVDRGLISTEIRAKSSEHSIDMEIVLEVVYAIAKKAIELLLIELKEYLKRKWTYRQSRR